MSKGTNKADGWAAARREIGGGTLSVIMPAYRLGHAIADNIQHVHAVFSGHIPVEIIPVDDGSDDDTHPQIEKAASQMPEVHPVYLTHNTGKGAALRAGFQASRGSHILLLDGDLDLPPHQVSGFFDIMEKEGTDIVIGSKRHPESDINYPWYRVLISIVYYGIVRLLVGLPLTDTQTGIKLFRREVLEWVFPRMLVKSFAFDLEILAIAHNKGYRVAEAPVTMNFAGGLGCARPTAIRQVMNDTLAVFYRLRILRYYQAVRDPRMPDPPPLVSIVIAYPAPTAHLDECLAGIARQDYRNYEVLLLPDSPPIHDSLFTIHHSQLPSPPREIPTGRVRPAEKRNIGIKQAKGEIIAFLDDDAYPAEDWLRKAVAYFSEPDIAAVGGPATTPPNDPFMAKMSGRVYANRLVSGNYRYRYVPDRVREIEDYPSCNLFARTSVLREIGGFHTEFWPGEDTYLCLEIVKNLRKKIVYDPWVDVYHHRRRLFLPHLRQVGRYALHRGYFARKFPETSRKLSYFIPSLFVIGFVAGAVLSLFSPTCRTVYLISLALYVLITFLASFTHRPLTWFFTWLGIILTHIVYGTRFLIGLITYRMPARVEPFDHASERVGSGG